MTISTHDRAKIDEKLPEYHKRKVANHMMKEKNVENKKHSIHHSAEFWKEKTVTVEITCHRSVKQ